MTWQPRPVFHDPRLEMPCHEFDSVDFTTRLPDQAPPETAISPAMSRSIQTWVILSSSTW